MRPLIAYERRSSGLNRKNGKFGETVQKVLLTTKSNSSNQFSRLELSDISLGTVSLFRALVRDEAESGVAAVDVCARVQTDPSDKPAVSRGRLRLQLSKGIGADFRAFGIHYLAKEETDIIGC